MRCRFFTENHVCGRFGTNSVPDCSISRHVPECDGDFRDCDKPLEVCPDAIMQGPQAMCKVVKEIRDCHGDVAFCDLKLAGV